MDGSTIQAAARASQQGNNGPRTIDVTTSRIRQLRDQANNLRYRVKEHTDQILGSRPEKVGGGQPTPGPGELPRGPALSLSLDELQYELNTLATEIERLDLI